MWAVFSCFNLSASLKFLEFQTTLSTTLFLKISLWKVWSRIVGNWIIDCSTYLVGFCKKRNERILSQTGNKFKSNLKHAAELTVVKKQELHICRENSSSIVFKLIFLFISSEWSFLISCHNIWKLSDANLQKNIPKGSNWALIIIVKRRF